jgi:glycosyltransferase involved in cell wall biosynthesis
MNPTVSIIIPCYNSEATIGKTLQSLQNQIFADWEAIVVNDGSTDNSAETIRQYRAKDARIKQIKQENQGLAGARNAGLAIAKGQFLNFLDADDLLLPDMLQKLRWRLQKDDSLAAAYGGWVYSNQNNKHSNWTVKPYNQGQLFERLAHSNLFPCHSVLLRREILENVGLFDSSLKHCHDWDLWLRIARAGGCFGCVSEPLVIYRLSLGSLSRNPLTFFESGKEILHRAHRPDPRVKKPDSKFAQGCTCSMKEELLFWLLRCVGLAIAIGDADQASYLFEKVTKEETFQITAQKMGTIRNAFWFGAAVPRSDWDSLWPRISHPLLQFLLRQEERLQIPGFAMQCILEIADRHRPMSGRELLSALGKKLTNRIFRLRI